MILISATDLWHRTYPGSVFGLLEVSQVNQALETSRLDSQKRETERMLRERYAGFTRQDFLSLPILSAYDRYYRRFGKTFHVLQQVESIVHKGKNLPNVSPLVDVNFAAEVDTLILTAGHDVDRLQAPISMDIAREGDAFVQMGGIPKIIPPGDMVMRDSQGLCCSIIYGQDNLSPITSETRHVLYVSYAPQGISSDQVDRQLERIKDNIHLFCPSAVVERQQTLVA